jgi:hypothetical protein
MTDTDADSVRRRIEASLEHLGLEQITFYYMWSIMSRKQYEEIMRKGGPYEGAMRAKEEGLIEHIVFSSHASPEETAYFLSEGAYDGAIISYSLLNFTPMQQVLDMAEKKKLGIAVMNPLAGGVIPQNAGYFRDSYGIKEERVTDFALKFIYAHEPVTSILSGITNKQQLEENVRALEELEHSSTDYIASVDSELKKLSNICTGCGYCLEGCPKKIHIPAYMQSYNMKDMNAANGMYGRTDKGLIKDILVMKKMVMDFQELPKETDAVCVRCGKCEKICTQHLPVMARIEEVRKIANRSGATQSLHKERLQQLLCGHGYRRIAFYTGGGYTAYVLEECRKYLNKEDQNTACLDTEYEDREVFEIMVVDSNPQKWGQDLCGYEIQSPDEMNAWKPDCVVISNYNYDEEISCDLKRKYPKLNIVKLHKEQDVPWVF